MIIYYFPIDCKALFFDMETTKKLFCEKVTEQVKKTDILRPQTKNTGCKPAGILKNRG